MRPTITGGFKSGSKPKRLSLFPPSRPFSDSKPYGIREVKVVESERVTTNSSLVVVVDVVVDLVVVVVVDEVVDLVVVVVVDVVVVLVVVCVVVLPELKVVVVLLVVEEVAEVLERACGRRLAW